MSSLVLLRSSAKSAAVASYATRRWYARAAGPVYPRHERIPVIKKPPGFDVEEHETNVFGGGVDISRPAPPKNPATVDGRDAFAVFDAIIAPKLMPGKVSDELVALGLGTLNAQDNPDLIRRIKRNEDEVDAQMKAALAQHGVSYFPKKNRLPSGSRTVDYLNEYWNNTVIPTFRARSDFAKVYERTKHLFVTYNVPPGAEPVDPFTFPERIALKKANKGKIEESLKHLKDINGKKGPVQADAFNYVLRKWIRTNISPKHTFITDLYIEQDKPRAAPVPEGVVKTAEQQQDADASVETRPPFETAISQLHSLFDDLPASNSSTCHLFIEAHLQGGDISGALEAIQTAINKKTVTEDPVHLYNHILEEVERFGSDSTRKDQADRVLQHMSANAVLPDAYTLASYIRAAKDASKPQEVVLATLREMNFLGIEPNLELVTLVAGTLAQLPVVGKKALLEQLVTLLKANPKLLQPSSFDSNPEVAVIDALQEAAFQIDDRALIAQIHELVEADDLLQSKLSPTYWDRYVMANSKVFDVARFTELYNKIKTKFEVSSLFYERYLKACREEAQAIVALRVIGDVRRTHRNKAAQRCYTFVCQSIANNVKKLVASQRENDRTVAIALVEHGVDLLKSINDDPLLPIDAAYDAIIEACLELGQQTRALELAQVFNNPALPSKLSRATLESFVSKCVASRSFDVAVAFLTSQKRSHPGLTESVISSVHSSFPAPFKAILEHHFPKSLRQQQQQQQQQQSTAVTSDKDTKPVAPQDTN